MSSVAVPPSGSTSEAPSPGRRRFLTAVAGVAGLAAVAGASAGRPAWARTEPKDDPFSLGVASGDPTPDGIVLWTRLAPHPLQPGGGMPDRSFGVDWELARDAGFRHVVRRGRGWALHQLAHSVHVEVGGLPSDTELYYRFRFQGVTSPVGRTRTAPPYGSSPERLTFGFASCQDWASGYYPSYWHAAEQDLAFMVFLGDYIYEGGVPADGGYRKTSTPSSVREAPVKLERWRLQYALIKSDPALQRAHAQFPWIVTWDDHEVSNDYAAGRSQYGDGDVSTIRAAAYQAWYEHQPVRLPRTFRPDGAQIYRRFHWGRLAQLDVLDGRQYRDVPPCGWGEADACEAQYAPGVSMLGGRQERWLYNGFARSRARWNILGSNVMMARLDHDGPSGKRIWNDAWDGFPAARKRLTDAWLQHDVSNPVVVTGDWHSTFVNDIKSDFDVDGSPVVATEFVGTSISTNGDVPVYGPYYGPMIKWNPHIRFFDGDRRGYVRCTVTPDVWRTDLQMVRTVGSSHAAEYTYATFEVDAGRPGAHRVDV